MLNNSICASLKFHNLPDDTCRLMATWLISHLDHRGVFYADPAMVKSIVFPRRADITLNQVAGYLDAMEDVGLIRRFQAGGDIWQHWPGFEHNQIGLRADRERTAYPPPDGRVKVATPPPAAPQVVGNKPESIRQESGKVPAEQNRTEVKVEEKITELLPPSAAQAQSPPAKSKPLPEKKPPLSTGAKEFLRLFSAKRFANNAQRDAVLALEHEHGTEKFTQAATWAAERGMSRGKAISAMRTALPKWGQPRASPGLGDGKHTGPHAGIFQWLESKGVEVEYND